MMVLVMMMRMITTTMMMMITIMMMSMCVWVGRWVLACSLLRGCSVEKTTKNTNERQRKNAETYEGNYTGKKFANDIKDEAGNYMDNEK